MSLSDQRLFEKYGREFEAGETLFKEGDDENSTFIILTGSVRVTKQFEEEEKTLAIIKDNDFVGEMSTLLGEPRSATATAEEPTKALMVSPDTFESMVQSNPKIALRIIKQLARRVKNTTQQLEILNFKDASRKVIYCLINAAENGTPKEPGRLAKLDVDDIASMAGIDIHKIKEILHTLFKTKLVIKDPEGFIVKDKEKVLKYLEYMEMKERLGDFSSEALKTVINVQRKNIETRNS